MAIHAREGDIHVLVLVRRQDLDGFALAFPIRRVWAEFRSRFRSLRGRGMMGPVGYCSIGHRCGLVCGKPGGGSVFFVFGVPVAVGFDDDLVERVGDGIEDIEEEAARRQRGPTLV